MKVIFSPWQRKVVARKGQTILGLAKEEEIPVHYECDGNCTCGTCYVLIESGMENLSPIGAKELNHLLRNQLPENARLSCQARILGDLSVKVIGKSP